MMIIHDSKTALQDLEKAKRAYTERPTPETAKAYTEAVRMCRMLGMYKFK